MGTSFIEIYKRDLKESLKERGIPTKNHNEICDIIKSRIINIILPQIIDESIYYYDIKKFSNSQQKLNEDEKDG